MAQNHNADYSEKPMTTYGRTQGPSRRYRRLRHPIFPAAEWTAKNPLLQRGEIGFEIDTHKAKVGDGVTYWNSLPYSFVAETEWGSIVGDINDQTDLKNALDDKVDKTTTASQVYGTDQNGDQTTYNITDLSAVDDVKVNNVSVVTNRVADIDLTSYLQNTATATDAITVNGIANTAWVDGINIGKDSRINSNNGIAIGVEASADVNAVGIGRDADAGVRGTAIGAYAKTSYDTGIAIGCWNSVMHNAVSSAKGAYQFGVGTNSTARTLNVGWYNDSVTPSTFVNYKLLDGDTGLIPDARISTNIARTADIPTVNDATLTIQKNGTTVDTFTANAASNVTMNITVPTTPADIGAQSEITASNKLNADLVDDSTSTNKFVTASDITTWNGKQDALTAGTNINITGTTISATDTTYTGSDGVILTGTNFTNSGVRSVASGTANGTISVNTNGTSADVSVTGLGSAAYTSSSDYATSAQGGKADTAVQPGDLATVATSGNYSDLTGKPIEWITYNTTPFADIKTAWDAGKLVLCSYGDRVYVCSYHISGSPQYFYFTCAESYTTVRYLRVSSTDAWINGGQTNQPVISDLATIRSGAAAGATAVQPGDLATVATSGSYNDLLNKPTIPAAQVNSDWDAISGVAQILNKPTIPTVNDATISVTQNGVSVGSFTLNQASGNTIALTDTTYSVMTGASAGDAGTSGLVPAPAAGDQGKFLQGDGTWANPTAATAWGNITGALGDQTDLANALAGKADTATTLAGYGITDGANTDLSNLTSTGANIGNWSTNVTNCITEIPQDIKLELSGGTLTLKAGSKVYVPNGVGVFDEITIANDITIANTWGQQVELFVYVKSDGSELHIQDIARASSGSTAPTQTDYRMWYDTTNNLIKRYHGSDTGERYSFPIALAQKGDAVESSNISSIDQVFNGFGYIGSTVFVLPNIKGLIPNGKNNDGTLNNANFTTTSVVTRTFTNNDTISLAYIGFDGSGFSVLNTTTYSYNYNFNYNYNSATVWNYCVVGTFKLASGVISMSNGYEFKQPFQAVDYNEADFVVAYQPPLATNNYFWYRIYKSGWIEQGCIASINGGNAAQITFPIPLASSACNITLTMISSDTSNVNNYLAYYDGQTTGFKVISKYSSGTARQFKWMVCGRIA